MLLLAAIVAFAVAAIDVGVSNDWSLPWLVPAGLAALAAHGIYPVPLDRFRRGS